MQQHGRNRRGRRERQVGDPEQQPLTNESTMGLLTAKRKKKPMNTSAPLVYDPDYVPGKNPQFVNGDESGQEKRHRFSRPHGQRQPGGYRQGGRRQEPGARRQQAGDRRPQAGDRRHEGGDRRREEGDRRREGADRRYEPGGRRQEPGGRRREPSSRIQEPGGRRQELGGRRQEPGSRGRSGRGQRSNFQGSAPPGTRQGYPIQGGQSRPPFEEGAAQQEGNGVHRGGGQRTRNYRRGPRGGQQQSGQQRTSSGQHRGGRPHSRFQQKQSPRGKSGGFGTSKRVNPKELGHTKVYTSDTFIYKENLDPRKPTERKMRSRRIRPTEEPPTE